jgi:hypothetical protein
MQEQYNKTNGRRFHRLCLFVSSLPQPLIKGFRVGLSLAPGFHVDKMLHVGFRMAPCNNNVCMAFCSKEVPCSTRRFTRELDKF